MTKQEIQEIVIDIQEGLLCQVDSVAKLHKLFKVELDKLRGKLDAYKIIDDLHMDTIEERDKTIEAHKKALVEARIEGLEWFFSHGWFHLTKEQMEDRKDKRIAQLKAELKGNNQLERGE